MTSSTLLPQKQAAVLSTNGLFDETQMYDTNNKRSLGLSENKKERCLNFWKFLPTLFQVSYQCNQLVNLLERSTDVSSKHETVEALKQNPENAP